MKEGPLAGHMAWQFVPSDDAYLLLTNKRPRFPLVHSFGSAATRWLRQTTGELTPWHTHALPPPAPRLASLSTPKLGSPKHLGFYFFSRTNLLFESEQGSNFTRRAVPYMHGLAPS